MEGSKKSDEVQAEVADGSSKVAEGAAESKAGNGNSEVGSGGGAASSGSDGKEGGEEGEAGEIVLARSPRSQAIMDGFRIVYMCMRDATTGAMKWESSDWTKSMFEEPQEAHVPRDILQCAAVSREIQFHSKQLINNFRLQQRVFFQGHCTEEWNFKFGFVIPGSTNTWQQTIEAARGAMLPAELLSGNVTIETGFYDGDTLVSKSLVRVFYDA